MHIGSNASDPILRMRGIVKRFAGATALEGVDFELQRGEVHALVGENGAGKSTLVKILSGAYHRDSGEVWLDGKPVAFETPAEAQGAGVIAVHQEGHLLRFRTVAENIFLGREPRRRARWGGTIDWSRMRADAAALLRDLGLDIAPDAVLGRLSTAGQQMVSIARGVSLGARVLVLDEPTSSLAEREVAILYELIRRLQSQGTAIIYISHRLDELYAICDRVTVLRDGRLVTTRRLAGLERIDLVCLMLGKSHEALRQGTTAFGTAGGVAARRATSDDRAPLLRAEGLERGRTLRDATLQIGRAEIVGLAGLLGSGRTETAWALFGAAPARRGTMVLEGHPFRPRSPEEGIRAGLGLVAEDRKAEGIIPDMSVRENLTLVALPTLTRFGIVSRARQREVVDRFVRRLGIRATSAEQKVSELSGGNQQKVLLARWLCTKPKLLILDEPTRGIDIGARGEIQSLVNELAESGLGVLMISSEIEELVEGCSRVVVMRDGRTVAELTGQAITERAIIHAMAEESQADG
ncbi:MAG: sugar ABC transporter ATP-binding protein [Gemmatimonadota bacterium]|nr:sugar ABC transporter ATP-binding protein [Gemmatimonadota bacterium]